MTRIYRKPEAPDDMIEIVDEIGRPDELYPSGLFKTLSGDRYLLTVENEFNAFAIALRHKKLAPLTCRELDTSTFPKGVQLGDCEIKLTHQCVYNVRRRPIGTLGINGHIVSVLCCYRKGVEWVTIGHLDEPMPAMEFDGWQIIKDDEIFFEQVAEHNAWPEVLRLSIDHPPQGRDSLIEMSP